MLAMTNCAAMAALTYWMAASVTIVWKVAKDDTYIVRVGDGSAVGLWAISFGSNRTKGQILVLEDISSRTLFTPGTNTISPTFRDRRC